MKRFNSLLTVLIVLLIIFAIPSMADAPPDPGEDPNGGGGTPVGGAPIGGGILAMALYGLLYGISKIRLQIKKRF